jgi:CRISPR-associated protein Cmr6
MNNLHYYFNKAYYDYLYKNPAKHGKEDQYSDTESRNERVVETKFMPSDDVLPFTEQCIVMETCYPGLLIGIGNAHEAERADGQIQMGFTLDYVTGVPVIPGSTVKGVLRSHFQGKEEFMESLLESLGVEDAASNLVEFEKALFEKDNVFFDAVPVATAAQGCRMLGLDNITPHKADDKRYEGLTEPTPLTMLKVIPCVRFAFRFRLKDIIINDKAVLPADGILRLFRELLELFGIGAKTNVGYGILEYVDHDTKTNPPLRALKIS